MADIAKVRDDRHMTWIVMNKCHMTSLVLDYLYMPDIVMDDCFMSILPGTNTVIRHYMKTK